MSFINIAGTQPVDDPEYRYKMPRLVAKIEGRGNGIKTLVVNCADIATALHRSTAEVCKFFGCELGAQSKYDEKNDRAIVNGAFEAGMMQQHLSKYIEGFVLCPACRLPETKYKFKGQTISHKCYACGAVESVDMNHRLTTFILKEHKSAKGDMSKKKEKKDRKKKSQDEPETEEGAPKEKKEKKSKDKGDKDSSDGKEKKEKKSKKDKKEKKSKDKSKSKTDNDDDDDGVVWHTDLSEEAVAARAAEAAAIEAGALAAMQIAAPKQTADDEDDVVATLDNLEVDDESAIDSVVSKIQTYLAENHSDNEVFEELCRQQTMSMLAITDRLLIFFRAAFTKEILSSNQVAKYSGVLEKIVDSKHAQYQLIALCEHFCAVDHPELMTSFPIVLKLLYDEELLEEECLVDWAKKGARKEHAHWAVNDEQAEKLAESLKPFIEWLENAEEETDDDDDDDDE